MLRRRVDGDLSLNSARCIAVTPDEVSPSTRLLSTALQDTMVLGYISGYTRNSGQYATTEWNSALHKAAQDVIALAIIAQADAIA